VALHIFSTENCAVLGYYAAISGNFLPIFWDNLSLRNYHYSLRNNTEQRRSHLLRSGSLKSHIFSTVCPTSSHDKNNEHFHIKNLTGKRVK